MGLLLSQSNKYLSSSFSISQNWLTTELSKNRLKMKLLDWMQHKFRQTNNEHLTEFAPRNSFACLTGQPSLDDLQYYPKSKYYTKARSSTQREEQFRKSFACIETARDDNEQTKDESAAAFSEFFHGFLTIGTLATETITNEPPTPSFSSSVENLMGKETEATESELKSINDELEKVLEPEGKEEVAENNENGAVVCPLQDYLFSSVIGLSETATAKKKHRPSLGELFQKTKTVEEITVAKSKKVEKQKEKETDKSAVHLMKKILKGRPLNSSSKRSTADKKPSKILQMFNRKVHPEDLPPAPKTENHSKYVTEGNFTEGYNNRIQMLSEDIILFPMEDTTKRGANSTKSYITNYACCMSDSDGKKECWIKSDSEYLVLEL